MKALQWIHVAVTFLLLATAGAFAILMLSGAIETRRPGGIQASERPPTKAAVVKAHLLVVRGAKPNTEYPIYEGQNILGRADQKPVDVDLEIQEFPDRVWSSRQHAVIVCENGSLTLEDLNSSNGTFVNRTRIQTGQKQTLRANDIIQIGEVQLKVVP